MIEPTVGRIVWYVPAMLGGINRPDLIEAFKKTSQPQAAIVTFVHPEGDRVNLARFSPEGVSIPETNVPLVQDDVPVPSHGGWCEWMPYQKGQAAKTESFEDKLAREKDPRAPQPGDVTT